MQPVAPVPSIGVGMGLQMTKKQVQTIADIARLAGVSKSTVSRALNDSPLIGEETKSKIRALAKSHDFRLNQPARRLSLRSSRTVAFVTHAYHKDLSYSLSDLFQLEILGGISRGLHEFQYDLLIVHVDPTSTDWIGQYLGSGKADGFILMTSDRKQYHIDYLLKSGAPFVTWGFPPDKGQFSTVSGDNLRGGWLAGNHLVTTGRKRVAFIGGPVYETEVRQRRDGFIAALVGEQVPAMAGKEEPRESFGLYDKSLLRYAEFDMHSAREAAKDLMTKNPDLDAIFAASDVMALGAIETIRAEGKRVPEDIAVVGYDDLSIAATSSPALTTIRQNIALVGRLLAQNLVQYLQSGKIENSVVPVELVVRASA